MTHITWETPRIAYITTTEHIKTLDETTVTIEAKNEPTIVLETLSGVYAEKLSTRDKPDKTQTTDAMIREGWIKIVGYESMPNTAIRLYTL